MVVVLKGTFNPAIVTPSWLVKHKLIEEVEGKTKIDIVDANLSSFRTGDFNIQVSPDTFQISSGNSPKFENARELTSSIFALLTHTPITMVGFNYYMHYEVDSPEKQSEILNKYAPLSPWEKIGPNPQIATLSVGFVRESSYKGSIRVDMQVSAKVVPGIYFKINDHYEVKEDAQSETSFLAEIVIQRWDFSATEALRISDLILS